MNRRMRSVLVLVTILALLVPALPAVAENPGQTASPSQVLAKLQPELRVAAQNPGGKDAAPMFVVVHAAKGADFSAFASKVIATNPDLDDEMQEYSFPVRAAQLLELAGRRDVIAVQAVRFERNGPDPLSEEERATKPLPPGKEVLAAQRAQISANKVDWKDAKAFGDGRSQIRPMDWFEVDAAGPHKAEAAWARGWDGTGVVAEVNDDGVDWAHPDLMGRQKIYNTTDTGTAVCGPKGCAGAYNGYPMAFSPFSMYMYVLDSVYGSTDVRDGFPGLHYADTSTTKTLSFAAGIAHFGYERVLDYGLLSPTTTFTVTQAQTKSGVVHVGTHPDENLRDFVYGEKAAVLVGDPNTAGVYDTVWVDLDMDYDFSDEKPMTRADVTSAATLAATKNNPIGYRDLNADGKADLSAGALYFIGDGVTPLPHAWVRYPTTRGPCPRQRRPGCL